MNLKRVVVAIVVCAIPLGLWAYKATNFFTERTETKQHNAKASLSNSLVGVLEDASARNASRRALFRQVVDPATEESPRRGALTLLELIEESEQADLEKVRLAFDALELPPTQQSEELRATAATLLDTYESFFPAYRELRNALWAPDVTPADLSLVVEERLRQLESAEQSAVDKFETARWAFMASEI